MRFNFRNNEQTDCYLLVRSRGIPHRPSLSCFTHCHFMQDLARPRVTSLLVCKHSHSLGIKHTHLLPSFRWLLLHLHTGLSWLFTEPPSTSHPSTFSPLFHLLGIVFPQISPLRALHFIQVSAQMSPGQRNLHLSQPFYPN